MILTGTLLSAKKVTPDEVYRLEEKYSELLGQRVKLNVGIDQSLIGGFVVKIGDRIWDESIRSVLTGISKKIEEVPDEVGEYINISEKIKELSEREPRIPYTPSAGTVVSVGDSIVTIRGMDKCRYSELIDFGSGNYGIAMNLKGDHVDCILIGGENEIREGDPARGTGRVLEVPVGDCVLGRIIDPLGRPIDEKGPLNAQAYRPIESPAPSILSRKPVSVPLQTGWIAIDSMVPLGRGQRQLVIGDRQTGKTTLAIDTIIHQKGQDVICIYVAIGQKASTVAQICHRLKEEGALDYTVVVSATASDSASMQYIAPYAGCAIGEHYMYSGKDVLIVYDDLSKHAVAYRTISLLLKRPPGREAYPGDVFYLHSRLLERSACLSEKAGGGSMTALPIIETLADDISAYIPTNVISITDGQIFLQSALFHAGIRPAINVGLSVSRVGGAAQTKAIREYAGKLRLDLAQYREMEVFARFGSDLDKETQALLEKGRQLVELLKQDQRSSIPMWDQAILIYVFVNNLLSGLTIDEIRAFKPDFIKWIHQTHPQIPEDIRTTKVISKETVARLREVVAEYLQNKAADDSLAKK